MKIVWLGREKDTVANTWLNDVYVAMVQGLEKHGEKVIRLKAKRDPLKLFKTSTRRGLGPDCDHLDLIIITGHQGWRHEVLNIGKWLRPWCNISSNYLVVEPCAWLWPNGSGYGFYNDRKKNISIGYNGLNGEADFMNLNSNDERRETVPPIKPWKSEEEGDYALIIRQLSEDASLVSKTEPPVDINTWTNEQEEKYLSLGYKVKIRPHPLEKPSWLRRKTGCPLPPLEEDLAKAKIVVTCSSSTGVISVLEGIPTVATYPVSMVYSLCKESRTPDRAQWIKDLSYCQWSLQEVANGNAWEHLKRK